MTNKHFKRKNENLLIYTCLEDYELDAYIEKRKNLKM